MVRTPAGGAAAMRAAFVLAASVLAAALALAACGGSATSASAGAPHSPPATITLPPPPTSPPAPAPTGSQPAPGGAPMVTVIRLNTTFTPTSLTLAAGQQFQVEVSSAIAATGTDFPSPCASGTRYPAAGGALAVTCPAAGDYLYTAEHAGTAMLKASVHPQCSAGRMCPQWVAETSLTVTIS